MTTTKYTFRTIATTALALAGAAANAQVSGGATLTEPTVATPFISNIPAGAAASWDPVYSVCRGPDPRCYHPWAKNRANKVLIYSRTAGPRHQAIGPALAAGKNPTLAPANIMQNALINWLAAVGIGADWTEDVGTFSSTSLNTYKAIIFADTSRDVFWKHGTAIDPTQAVNTTTNAQMEAAKTAVMQYMRAGGGAMMIHNAVGGTDYQWAYFTGLAGSQYYDHGANQAGTVYMVGTDSSSTGIPARWGFQDEFYNFYPYPERVKFVAMVDESTMATKSTVHPGHGAVHPVAWCQYFDGGRAFTMEIGHDPLAWTDGSAFPGQAIYKQFVVQAIQSVMGNYSTFCGFGRS